ncbi:heptaprenyl diphosphate synthase [Levilactobacillus zymae]|uniref:Heptaprenyl diphosphate synthase n=1 Tax=Levilactobacillus zymae TaxID=267363 RepID=A0ABQ0WX29_9LACO|nr:polyprenyl synthetase family protein [Levilactobacillus zymae]KRL13610.1 geranylgeranyl pyrophosphate synthase [Levilactobacillus zymae DSM 19395]QFR61147.1 polyprenyl synthetase family protein [Levilactobacillus zymae]GEO71987.1 heptaprenyl diphosphate synthase [Levilactobacillus zymae]
MDRQLWRQFPQVEPELNALQPYLLDAVKLTNQPIHNKILALLESGGKLLRPGYFYLFTKFGDQIPAERLRAGAAALEILHVGTLIHDDVIDGSPTRRGVRTIQMKYGQRNAIYAGDFMFTVYFDQVLKSTSDTYLIQSHINAMHKILTGELGQMALNYREDATLDAYLSEIAGKTAELFALACYQGAMLTNAPQAVQDSARPIGEAIGSAYQMLDDILDYAGDPKKTRKPILEDLRSGVYSLPLLLALPKAKRDFHQYLKKRQDMTEADILAVRELVTQHGGVEAARQLATEWTDKALELIAALPAGSSRDALARLTGMLLKRDH